MDTEDMRDALTLLEEAVNSNIFDFQKINIRPDKICKNIRGKKFSQLGGKNKKEEISTSNSDTTDSNSSTAVTGDSVTVGDINVPSEIFLVYKKGGSIESHNNSHYNLAFSSCSRSGKSDSDFEKIVNIKKNESDIP